jgi:hypothetical protein
MTLAITINNDWIAVSNDKETRYESPDGEGREVINKFGIDWFLGFYDNQEKVAVYEFQQTPKISTYLYAVCAGPYLKFEDFDPAYPPQRVFVRESLV